MEEIAGHNDKRFSSSELAAEYWHAVTQADSAMESCYPYYDEQSYHWPRYLRAFEIAETFKRFAILPHAF